MRLGRGGRWTALGAAMAIAVGVLAGSGPVDAQAVAVTLAWTPVAPGPDDAVDVTISGCSEEPTLSAAPQGSDVVIVVFVTDAGAGTWTATVPPSETDVDLFARCAEGEVEATVDVENPVLFAIPVLAAVPGGALATDCADQGGSGPAVIEYAIATSGGTYPADAVDAAPPDGEGDLVLGFTEPFPPGTVTVTVTCGGFAYDPLVFTVAGPPATTSTSTTTTVAGPAPAAPATPVDGAARFTG